MKILIVDDNLESPYLLNALLRGNGYDVAMATNGAEALEQLQQNGFDMIIADILMPEMDGFQLCRLVKTDERLKKTAFVFYTSTYTTPQDEAFALRLGAQKFIIKPQSPEDFVALLQQIIRDYAAGRLPVSEPPEEEEQVYLQAYNQRLVRKLEDKMLELERMNKILTEAEAKYRELVENANDVVIVIDPDGRVGFCNPKFCELIGYTMEEAQGLHFQQFIHPGDFEQVAENFRRRLAGEGAPPRYEVRCVTKSGETLHVEIAVTVIQREGKIVGALSIARDVTNRKRAETALRETNQRLEETLEELQRAQSHIIQQERLRALGTMASGIAHDFNNVLMPILGYAELLLIAPQGLEDKDKTLDYLQIIHTAARDAANLVSRLREFYRQRDEAELLIPVDLRELIQQAISLTQPKWKDQAQARGVDVRMETDLQDVPLIPGNASELREALTNLIFNAVDAMPNGGKITIRTSVECRVSSVEGTTGEPSLVTRHPSLVTLSVSDTGIGMSEDVRRRCFEPFYSTKGERGSGLGLSMVYGIAQRHGGTIEVESVLGEGTTVIIRLPIEARQGMGDRETESAAPPRPLRVLLVDDEPLVRDVITEFLLLDKHNVTTAVNGRDGLEKFRAGWFDLIITDWAMPEMNGEQFSFLIKQIAPNKPIILLTGFGVLMHAAGEHPKSVDVVVSKPVTLTALRRAVARVMAE